MKKMKNFVKFRHPALSHPPSNPSIAIAVFVTEGNPLGRYLQHFELFVDEQRSLS